MVKEAYQEMLEQVNEEAIHLINADAGDHIGYYLTEKMSFERFEENSTRLKFSGENMQIIYSEGDEVPFKVILDEPTDAAISEVKKTLESILKKVLEDI